MLQISNYIDEFPGSFKEHSNTLPWLFVSNLHTIVLNKIQNLSSDFIIKGSIAIHKTAVIEEHAILKGPVIIAKNCFVASHVYLRNGVFLGDCVSLGPGCEIKSSCIFSNTAIAHFNFVGDSLIGSRTNMEGGAVIANHFNERTSKEIQVTVNGERIKTGVAKFGALVGDASRIGANAVLSPGTILAPGSIVRRLELIEQI